MHKGSIKIEGILIFLWKGMSKAFNFVWDYAKDKRFSKPERGWCGIVMFDHINVQYKRLHIELTFERKYTLEIPIFMGECTNTNESDGLPYLEGMVGIK